jgi:uncharacterized tellurite resistance protein B-like protein
MEPLQFSAQQARLGLRALKVVALANGVIARKERELIDAAAEALGIHDVGELNGVAPEELAAELPDPTARLRVVQAMMVMALIDGEAGPEETREVARFAAALGVDDPRIAMMRDVLDGHLEGLKFELYRRDASALLAFDGAASGLKPQALGHAIPRSARAPEEAAAGTDRQGSLGSRPRDAPDAAVAARYHALRQLPPGTFGRAYADYMAAKQYAFPGEPGGFSERVVIHDLLHVLSGYGGDPQGEAQLAAFTAGFHRVDPFGILFGSLMVLNLAAKAFVEDMETTFPPSRHIDPKALVRAFERGMLVNTDFLDRWDPWPAMSQPLDEIRRTYGIQGFGVDPIASQE